MILGLYNFSYQTQGERFYEITKEVQSFLKTNILSNSDSGILHLFLQHTSCALTISEAYDPSAKVDLENFLKHLAPRNLSFIKHTMEGPDDSPSHMKSILLQHSLSIIVEKGELYLGTWQGIYLCEFRDSPKKRNIILKFMPD